MLQLIYAAQRIKIGDYKGAFKSFPKQKSVAWTQQNKKS